MSASLQETIAYLREQFKKQKGDDDDSHYRHTIEMVEILTSLDDGGLGMIDSLIDIAVEGGKTVEEAMSEFSYKPPHINVSCEVKQSEYGRGVFATRDIKKGDTITLYPAHCLATPTKDGKHHQCEGYCEYDAEYAITHSTTKVIHTGDKRMEDPLFLGHLINDFCSFVGELKEREKDRGGVFMKYYLHSLAFQNVGFDMGGKHFITIKASKDIKEGEELLIAYSLSYWTQIPTEDAVEITLEYIKNQTDPKKGRFLCDKFIEFYKSKY